MDKKSDAFLMRAKGGRARWAKLSKEEKTKLAKKMLISRWKLSTVSEAEKPKEE